MHVVRKIASLLLTGAIACTLLAGCGGNSTTTGSTVPPKASFTYAVTNLSVAFDASGSSAAIGGALTYAWNFGDSGTDTIAKPTHVYTAAGSYAVILVVTDTNASSVSRVQTVTVTGGTPAGLENWAWMSGSKYANSFGVYETQIVPSAANQPSSRQSASSWTNAQGQMWLFGGSGEGSNAVTGVLNDLWRFDPTLGTSGEWTWVNGSNKANAAGVYGTQGTAAATNMPGARGAAASWTDASGNFWLFGGAGYDSAGTYSNLNDMWMLNPLTGAAIWMTGSKTVNGAASYGVLGVASAANTPGARSYATSWTANGKLWLFGGATINAAGTATVLLNDLWVFDPASKQWTWMGGSSTATNVAGVYGTQNTGSTANLPGGRVSAQSWTDASGNLWLFGGSGYDSAGTAGVLNDMWSYNPTSGAWTWVTGSKTVSGASVWGTTLGTPAATYTPSARLGSVGWTDPKTGMLWLFGGGGFGSIGIVTASVNELNDLWRFNPTTLQWAKMGGLDTLDGTGIYATALGNNPSNLSTPGARMWSTGWVLASGSFWLFGGAGVDSTVTLGFLNDLWNVQIQP